MTEALYHCALPIGVELVLPKEEYEGIFANPVSREVHEEFYRRFRAACVAYTKAKGIPVKSIKAEEHQTGGASIFVIAAGSIDAAYFPAGYSQGEEEYIISVGMTVRVREALNAEYYAAEREDFSVYAAIRKAHEAGKRFVIVEDLS